MNNYYTLLHLTDSLKRNLIGASFVSATTSKKHILEIRFELEGKDMLLTMSTDSSSIAVFLGQYRDAPSSNVKSFFESLEGCALMDVELAETDRLLRFRFDNGESVLFKAFSAKANVFHVKEGRILESFKQDSMFAGEAEPVASPSFSLSQRLPKHAKENALNQILTDPRPALVEGIGFTLLSEDHLPGVRLKRYLDVNEAVRDVFLSHWHERTFIQKKTQIEERLRKLASGLDHMLAQLAEFPQGLVRADSYEHQGHLLMANAHREVGADEAFLMVDDWTRDNEPVSIPIRSGVSIAQSAEWFFKKAKETRMSVRIAEERLKETRIRLEATLTALDSLQTVTYSSALEKWKRANASVLDRTGFDAAGEDQVRLPYRRMDAGGYEIWVGKNAQSNDEMLRLAHKDDLWFHARGSAGSHVILRMRKQKARPPQNVLEKAAALAAWYSKQKGSSLVPVILTQRKYVRKPKGAPPGTVLVEREDVFMVTPDQGV